MEESLNSLHELEHLNSEIEGLFTEIRGKEDSFLSRIKALEAELETSKAIARTSLAQSGEHEQALRAELGRQQILVRELTEKLETALQMSESLRSANGSLAQKYDAEKLRSDAADEYKRELTELLSRTKAELTDKTLEIERLDALVKDFEKKYLATASLLKEERARLDDHSVFISSAKSSLKDKEEELSRIWGLLEKERARTVEFEARLKEKETDLDHLIRQHQALELSSGKSAGASREALAAEAAKNDKLTVALAALQTRFNSVSAMLEEEKTAIRDNEVLLVTIRSALKDREEEISRQRTLLEQANSSVSVTILKLKEKEGEADRLSREKQALELELQKSEAASARIEQGFNHKMELLKKELKTNEESRRELLTMVKRDESERENLRAKIAELEKETEAGDSRWRKTESELNKAAALVRERENAAEIMRGKLAAAESERELYKRAALEAHKAMAHVSASGSTAAQSPGKAEPPGESLSVWAELTELLSGVSHQVSNSMGIIRSNAEYCLEAAGAENIKEPLDAIVRNIGALQKKIDDILVFSRPVSLQYGMVNLRLSAQEAFDKAVAGAAGYTVSFEESPGLKNCEADHARLVAALEQIFRNSVDAMPEGGVINVRLSGDEARREIEITDVGHGFSAQELQVAFHPFFTTRPARMGLGLPLAQSIVKAHGGEIKLSNGPQKGARVTIILPAQPRI